MIRFCLVTRLANAIPHVRLTFGTNLRISLLHALAVLRVFLFIGTVARVVGRWEVRSKGSRKQMLIANTLCAEQAGCCEIGRLEGWA